MQVPLHNGGCESHSWYGSCISSTAGCLALAGERVRGAAPRGIVLAGWLPCLSARPDPTWVSLACLPAHMHTSTDAVVCGVRAGSCKRASACAAPRRAARHHARRSLSAASDTAAVLFGWLSGCVSSRWPPPQATMAPWASWRARWRVRQPRADAMASAASRAFETCI